MRLSPSTALRASRRNRQKLRAHICSTLSFRHFRWALREQTSPVDAKRPFGLLKGVSGDSSATAVWVQNGMSSRFCKSDYGACNAGLAEGELLTQANVDKYRRICSQ